MSKNKITNCAATLSQYVMLENYYDGAPQIAFYFLTYTTLNLRFLRRNETIKGPFIYFG